MSSAAQLSSPILEVRRLSKSFSGIRVLHDVHLAVFAGEVHAVMGENGAGKSTLMKMLAGLEQPDSGEILFRGQPRRFVDPHAAITAGIAMIHQELMPFRNLSVAENIFIGREPRSRMPGAVARAKMIADAGKLLEELGLPLSPQTLAGDLKISELQMIEIAKAVSIGADVLIMDEPTSAISAQEVATLFRLIADLRRRGVAILYISHKMDEIYRIADRITVLRDGRHVSSDRAADLDAATLIARIAGRKLTMTIDKPKIERGTEALSVRGLTKRGKFRDISFQVCHGEILGLAGMMGAGRTEVVNAIYGLDPADAGEIRLRGRPARITRPAEAIRGGIGLVSEDRRREGLVLGMSVEHNLTLTSLWRCSRGGWIRRRQEQDSADDLIARFAIKVSHRDQPVKRLSGGNQQKVVLAKALFTEPEILILDEPTRGVDIGAKMEIYALIVRLAQEGRAVIMVSSELPELLLLCDRLLVLREGALVAELDPQRTTQDEIVRYALAN